ncbi:helix-turn-helix domain-containing protein [bacterium]|nr:helix-turn-helix domain-containing protein [bacterium]
MNFDLVILGNRIREQRLKKKLSQEKLAELANMHRNYVGMVERGERNITISGLNRICVALEVKMADLLSDY